MFEFVKKVIDVGHVHQHRVVGRSVSNGSFDRLNHGDEDPKGLIRIEDYPDTFKLFFVENEHAAIFNTIKIPGGSDTTEIIDLISRHMVGLKTSRRINIRFEIVTTDVKDAIRGYMVQNHPDVKLAPFKMVGDKDEKALRPTSSVILQARPRNPMPTPQTLPTFIRAYIPEEIILSVEKIETYLVSKA